MKGMVIVLLSSLLASLTGYSQEKASPVRARKVPLMREWRAQRMQQEYAEVQALRAARKGYVPGVASPTWAKELRAWAKARNWFDEKPYVLEFTDSAGYRHPLGIGYVKVPSNAADDVSAREMATEKAELAASANLTKIFAKIKEETTDTSVKMSFGLTTMRGMMTVYETFGTDKSGAQMVVVVKVQMPGGKTAKGRN